MCQKKEIIEHLLICDEVEDVLEFIFSNKLRTKEAAETYVVNLLARTSAESDEDDIEDADPPTAAAADDNDGDKEDV